MRKHHVHALNSGTPMDLKPGDKLVDEAGRVIVIKGESERGSHLIDVYFDPPLSWCTEQTMFKTYLLRLKRVEEKNDGQDIQG